jgi:hypothetical protein
MLEGQHLLGHDRQHLVVDPVELVEAVPGLAGGQPLEQVDHLRENDLVAAVVDARTGTLPSSQ